MFKGCTSLTDARFTSTEITTIKEGTFQGCSKLQVFALPLSITTIEDYAFDGTDLTEITNTSGKGFDENLVTIGAYAYRNNARLQSFAITSSVQTIGYAAFSGCGALTKVSLTFIGMSKDATGSQSLFGWIFGRDEYVNGELITQYMKINPNCVDVNNEVGLDYIEFLNENGEVATYTTVDEQGNEIIHLGERFYIPAGLLVIDLTDLKSNTITNGQLSGVTTVEEVILPISLTTIETAAFSGLHNLITIEIP